MRFYRNRSSERYGRGDVGKEDKAGWKKFQEGKKW
jgi:hypothetical protein